MPALIIEASGNRMINPKSLVLWCFRKSTTTCLGYLYQRLPSEWDLHKNAEACAFQHLVSVAETSPVVTLTSLLYINPLLTSCIFQNGFPRSGQVPEIASLSPRPLDHCSKWVITHANVWTSIWTCVSISEELQIKFCLHKHQWWKNLIMRPSIIVPFLLCSKISFENPKPMTNEAQNWKKKDFFYVSKCLTNSPPIKKNLHNFVKGGVSNFPGPFLD